MATSQGPAKALVTGAAGLIGSHFCRFLLSAGWAVVGIDDFSGGYRENLPAHSRFKLCHLDLVDYKKVKKVFLRESPDVVYHFAAYAAEGLSPFIRQYNYRNNLMASASLINGSIESGTKLVFTSSMAVYGEQKPPFHEGQIRRPIDPYGIAKAAVEADLESASAQHGLSYSIVRPHNVVGRYQNIWDRYRNVIGIFIRRTLDGEPMQIFGDGNQLRAFSDVRFYMKPLERLATEYSGEIFNLGSDKYYSVLEAAQLVESVMSARGFKPKIEFVEARHEVHEAWCSHEKAQELLGFEDDTDLRSVIEDMVEWAITQKPKRIRAMRYEISSGLYSFWK